MHRKAPGGVRLEHVILEDEGLRVAPVVRDVAPVVVAHNVDASSGDRTSDLTRIRAAAIAQRLSLQRDETVHRSVVDVVDRIHVLMWPTGVAIARVVERPHTYVRLRVRGAHLRLAGFHRDTVRARKGPEVGVE